MSQQLSVDAFKCRKDKFRFNEEFIQDYDEHSEKSFLLEVDVKYPKELCELHRDPPFLPKRMNIEKSENLMFKLFDKKNYVIHIKAQK